jgi:hypothetical protein
LVEAADDPIPRGPAFRSSHLSDFLLQLAWQADGEVTGLGQLDYFTLVKRDEPSRHVLGEQ